MISWDIGLQASNFKFGHHYQASPVYISYLLTSRGFECPSIEQDFTACELSSGQCLSIDLHALTVQGSWYGAGLDPQQVETAQDLAAHTDLQPQDLVLCNEPLAEFLQRSDLPEFSYICLQGVWSFIPPATQQALIEFLRRKLKIGGVLYISYQTEPSKTNFEPIVHLLSAFDREINAQVSDPQERQANLFNFLQSLVSTQARGLTKDVSVIYQIEELLKTKDPKVLAELLQPDWNTCSFKAMAGAMEQAKLNFACSAALYDLVDDASLKEDQQKFLAPFNGTELGEIVRDFMVAPYKRHDLFVKGLRTLSYQDRLAKLQNIQMMLAVPLDDVQSSLEKVSKDKPLPSQVCEQICKLLSDYQPHSFKEVFAAVDYHVERSEVEEVVRILVYINKVFIVRAAQQVTDCARQRCLSFNQHVLDDAHNHSEFLVSPLLGGGVHLSPLNMQILRAFRQHLKTESSLDSLDLTKLTAEVAQLLPDPKLVAAAPEQQLEFVTEYVEKFKLNNLVIYQILGLV